MFLTIAVIQSITWNDRNDLSHEECDSSNCAIVIRESYNILIALGVVPVVLLTYMALYCLSCAPGYDIGLCRDVLGKMF